jgi:hypothetical protein
MVYRRDDTAVSPVIGEVLMVAIVVILAAIVYLVVADMLHTPDEERISLVLANPDVEGHERGATPTPVWDVTMNVDTVRPTSREIIWDNLFIHITASNGSMLLPKDQPASDNPAMYDNNDGDGIDVELWYVETTAGSDKVSGGDGLKVTGMDPSYEGATIYISKSNELVAKVVLPTNFS